MIRRAEAADIAAITAIYNEAISNSDAIYRESPVAVSERSAWFDAKVRDGYPVLVALFEDEVVGYGVYGNFRFGEGYSHTVEHSVHVRHDRRGVGIGKQILSELISIAKADGRHVMVAAIDSENVGSIALHANFGFQESARMNEVAKKHGQLLTLVLMQKILREG